MNERFLKIIQLKGMTATQFADALGIQRSAISHFASGRNKPSLELIIKVLTLFPDINVEWLLFGKGEPLRTDVTEPKTGDGGMAGSSASEPVLPFPEQNSLEEIQQNQSGNGPEGNMGQEVWVPEARTATGPETPINQRKSKADSIASTGSGQPEQIVFCYPNRTFKIYKAS